MRSTRAERAEEAVLWAVLRRVLPDGHELTLEVEREHQEVNELVTRLEVTAAGEPARASLLDRLRDLVDGSALLFPGRAAPALHRTGSRLADVARRLEHLPVMRRGEDPSTSSSGG